ncbi:cell adhesion molecule 2-like [Antedon mediterranea]|uniref:cell adhesion molecule 2-like n=1 Tax=Antedon mediterranea TaxID=105859 RepID=UPI003AF92AA3
MKFRSYMLIVIPFLYEASSFTGFLKQPSDESVAEGELTFFSCIVQNLDGGEYVSWLYNAQKISKNDIITNKMLTTRYSIDFDPVFKKYNLQIYDIHRSDEGQYTCAVYDKNEIIVKQSKTANFTVLQTPGLNYPICTLKKQTYIVGEAVVLVCISEVTKPSATLSWVKYGDIIKEKVVNEMVNGNHQTSFSFTARKSDNRAIFICELTTPANPSIRRNCSSGPFNIVYPPIVHIQQTSDVILGNEGIFICYSDANPQETTFEWSFDPPIEENMYLLESERILRIENTISSLNGTSVICKVTNSIGSGSSKLILKIRTEETINNVVETNNGKETDTSEKPHERNKSKSKNQNLNNNQQLLQTNSPNNNSTDDISISLVVIIALVCIIVILGLAMIPVGYMKYTRRQPSDTISRGRPVSLPDVYFEPRDHIDPMLPQLGLAAPWMKTVGVQVPGECEYDVTYNTQVMPQLRQVYYTQRMYPAAPL